VVAVADKALETLTRLRSGLSVGETTDRKRAREETLKLFSKKPKIAWKHKFVCLGDHLAQKIPTAEWEKALLLEAGLGEQEVEFTELSPTYFKSKLYSAFPKLEEGGGFHLMKCKPNSRNLEILPMSLHSSPINLKQRVGNARTYIRPIQRDLDLSSLPENDLEVVCIFM
jgi:hypothetical protein